MTNPSIVAAFLAKPRLAPLCSAALASSFISAVPCDVNRCHEDQYRQPHHAHRYRDILTQTTPGGAKMPRGRAGARRDKDHAKTEAVDRGDEERCLLGWILSCSPVEDEPGNRYNRYDGSRNLGDTNNR